MSTQPLIVRSQVKPQDKWNVESLYSDVSKFNQDFENIKDLQSELKTLLSKKGTLLKSSSSDLKDVIELQLATQRKIVKLYVYSHLRHDEDTTDDENKGMHKKASSLYHEFSELTSWIEPELLALPENVIKGFLESKELSKYKFYIENIVLTRDHVLTPEMEQLLAQAGDALGSSSRIFGALNNSDFDFGSVLDGKGELRPLSHGSYGLYIRDQDRVLRKNAFEAIYKKYAEYQNTLAETLNGNLQKDFFYAKARKYDTCLEAALFSKNIPVDVYKSLIKAVRDNIGTLHKYISLRKKVMKVDELHLYDIYVPLIESKTPSYTWEQAVDYTIKAAKYLGPEYQKKLEKGLIEERWCDKFENKGKRSGAYSSGCYDSSPFILMNFNGSLNDVFTLTHECGHSMHTLNSKENQEYHYSDYSIFVAEVASTFNEDMLRDYLLKESKSKEEKIYLINQAVEDIRATLFRQVMLAEFELRVHEFAEAKTPITPKLLKDTYYELNQFYFGKDMVIDRDIELEWARIPHFYYNYYVYQYATGISAAIFLANRVRNGGDQEREDYLNFLKGGSSKYPIDMLKVAGVDMKSGEAVDAAMKVFGTMVDELEQLLSE